MIATNPALPFCGGCMLGTVVTAIGWWALVVRPLRRDHDVWRNKAAVLYSALLPFVPPIGRASHRPSGRAAWRWRCHMHNLLGGRYGDEFATSADVLDEAREHFREKHLTPANFAAARRAIDEITKEA